MPRFGVNVFPWKLKHWSRETEDMCFPFLSYFYFFLPKETTDDKTNTARCECERDVIIKTFILDFASIGFISNMDSIKSRFNCDIVEKQSAMTTNGNAVAGV